MAQQGTYELKLNTADGKPLVFNGSSGPDKLLEFIIPFARPFHDPPMVHLGITGINAVGDADTNWKPTQSFQIQVQAVTAQQFTVHVQVSWYNKAFAVQTAWLALEV